MLTILRKSNNSKTLTIYRNSLRETFWRKIRVGDLILIPKDTRIPADLLILASSEKDGSTFMETSTLDGEKNLKPRYSLKETYQEASISLVKRKKQGKNEMPYTGSFDVNMNLHISVQHPDPSLYKFEGFIKELDGNMKKSKKVPIGTKNFLFKGAMIRNVDWTLGVVLYTGTDTKIQQNGSEGRYKISTMESKLHMMIVMLFGLQVLLAIIAVIVKAIMDSATTFEFDVYLQERGSSDNDTLLFVFIRYFILLNSLIPISLIVNLELVRLTQAYFMKNNIELKNSERNM